MEDENRNCGCNSNSCTNNDLMNKNCNYTPQGINAAFGYNTQDNQVDNNCNCCNACNMNDETRENMINKIKALNFSVIELSLYLNTHPNDQKALCLHREYTKELKELKDKYQKVYGPLSIYYPCNKWRWLENPWPWEGGNY